MIELQPDKIIETRKQVKNIRMIRNGKIRVYHQMTYKKM